MEAEDLHDLFCGDAGLRHAVSLHPMPSVELVNHAVWLIPRDRKTVEIGVSVLSIYLARHATEHICVAPSLAAAEGLARVLAEKETNVGALAIRAADDPAGLADIPDESVDAVVLSCTPAFPAYFAWCHEALRILRIGGRLVVRGAGVWTIDQFKNHLRVDPRFVGWTLIAPDAIQVLKEGETQHVAWTKQPFVLVNSTLLDDKTARRAKAQPLQAGLETYSTVAAEAALRKSHRETLPQVGLIGYYGFGNYGDELFRTCFETGLPDVRLHVLNDLPRRPFILGDRRARVDPLDAVLIGGGDLIIAGYWPDPYFDEAYLRKPVFIHGVGVPRWLGGDPRVIGRLRDFMQHANVRHINVRDVESRDWIETYLKPRCPVEVSSDIVCGLDLPEVSSTEGGAPTLALITRRIKVDNETFAGMRGLVRAAQSEGFFVRLVIAGAGMIGDDDLSDALTRELRCDEIVPTANVEEATAAIVSADVVASMKFHGCVVGLMAGKPTFGLVNSNKFENLYRALGLEHMTASFTDPEVAAILDRPRVAVDPTRLAAMRDDARAAMARLGARIAEAVG